MKHFSKYASDKKLQKKYPRAADYIAKMHELELLDDIDESAMDLELDESIFDQEETVQEVKMTEEEELLAVQRGYYDPSSMCENGNELSLTELMTLY